MLVCYNARVFYFALSIFFNFYYLQEILVTLTQTICLITFVLGLLFVIKHTDFRKILNERKWQHIVFGFSTGIFILWLFRVSIHDGLVLHFLGLTMLTLVLGFRWAMLSASLILLACTALGFEPWHMLGVNGLLKVYLPIIITYAIFTFTFHKVPRQLFTYIFLCAFFPGAISIAASMMSLSFYYYFEGLYSWDVIYYNYAQMTWLLIFQEAFFNGVSMTCLIVYKPDLVYTFHDKFYIDGK